MANVLFLVGSLRDGSFNHQMALIRLKYLTLILQKFPYSTKTSRHLSFLKLQSYVHK
ncbi:flavoprotein [Streptococcus suis]|nr:flavoprotein [Streptococcus suis]